VRTGDIPVYLIFAGNTTTGFGSDGSVDMNTLVTAVNNILNSSFLSGLSEYGAATHAHVAGTFVSNYNLPLNFNDNGNNGDINNLVSASISDGGGTLPEPDDTDADGIYMVFTPKGYSLGGNVLGHHSNGHTGSFLDPDTADDGVVTSTIQAVPNPAPTANQPANQVNFVNLSPLDTMTETFSHELAEIISDPDSNGVVVTAPNSFSQNYPNQVESPGEIGDNEGEFYVGFENGTMVQSYWSAQGGDYIIPGATAQKVALNGGALSIKGDRLVQVDDSLTIDTTGSGGVQITLDGETEQFAPGQVTQINVTLGGGTNTVTLASLPPGVSISIDGSGGTTSLTAPNGPNTWQISGAGSGTLDGVVSFSSIQNLTGGTGTDQFQFQAAGSIPGNIDGGGGGDTLDYSALAGPITVNIPAGTAPGIGGTFSNISNFVGSASMADTIIGPDAIWTLSGSNAGSVNGFTFSSFENLTGSSGPDQFIFLPGGSISGNLDGGGGSNTLDYSNLAGPITVNLQAALAPGIGGTFSSISNFVGSAGSDTLVGPDVPSTWNLNGANAGSVGGSTFSAFENLTGGSAADQFVFYPGGSIAGNLDGGGGSNTLDYSHLAGPITINLQGNTATGIGGTFSNIITFIGSAGSNTLQGPNAPTQYAITGVNTITVNGLTFGGFQNLVGGSGNDQFSIQTGGRLDGMLDGGGGVNTLLYSAYSGAVFVDLPLNMATAVGQGVFDIQNVTGGQGNSMLVGDANPNVLMGGTGRNIIIGGAGADTIAGGGGDNILIGGSTVYDQNLLALQAIMAEWTRTDLSFEQRLAQLISEGENDGRLNGIYVLNKKSVQSDGATDSLTGGGGHNWFFATNKEDLIFNRMPQDHLTVL
jgi:Ca2+-binding RTX toxin-like protein